MSFSSVYSKLSLEFGGFMTWKLIWELEQHSIKFFFFKKKKGESKYLKIFSERTLQKKRKMY